MIQEDRLVMSPLARWALWLVIIGVALLFLVHARAFLLPIVIAFLIFTVLTAGISKVASFRILGIRLPHWLAASFGLVLILVLMVLVYSVDSGEILLIVAEWPRILERVDSLVASVSYWLGEDLEGIIRASYADFSSISAIRSIVTPAGLMLTSMVIVVLYVGFMFVESAYLPKKITKLLSDSPRRSEEVFEITDQIIKSVHRYLLLKTLLSAGSTLAVYAIMRFVGLEFAETWAMLTFLLNFIPKIGSITATVIPSVFAILQFPEWQPILIVIVGIAAAHTITGEVVEPMVMGRTLNLSSFVIMLALTFWAMVWGIAGAFLAVPLTAVILIICSKIEALRPVAILLSSDGNIPAAPIFPASSETAGGN